jgi:hypothetical protein
VHAVCVIDGSKSGAKLASTCVVAVSDDAWRTWLAETNQIMRLWDSARGTQLSRAESASLVSEITDALMAAAERYKRYVTNKQQQILVQQSPTYWR